MTDEPEFAIDGSRGTARAFGNLLIDAPRWLSRETGASLPPHSTFPPDGLFFPRLLGSKIAIPHSGEKAPKAGTTPRDGLRIQRFCNLF
jgi:hypothetical protein